MQLKKKVMGALFASAFMVCGAVGQAAAYFEQGAFAIGVYFDEPSQTKNEVMIDTGYRWDSNYNVQMQTIAPVGSVSYADFGLSNWSGLRLGAVATSGLNYETGVGDYWFASSSATDPKASGMGAIAFENSVNQALTTHSGSSSYKSVMGPTYGWYNLLQYNYGQFTDPLDLNLSALNSQESVEVYIYHYVTSVVDWDTGELAANLVAGNGTDYAAKLIVYADGHVVLDAASGAPAVPIPGAVWLFGSGLLGLVGIRRRNS